ncbi:amidohydrolase family protein [Paraburkholderia sp.]|uniref:amidohydrolase family protein n=1 Tax=Paraburkholderia sp. TaxID=1926495 RepID=UPI0039E2D24C
MDLLITDTVALTCDDARSVRDHVSIAIVGNRIAAIGPTDTLAAAYPHLARFDGRGLAVLPGFVNAHTHTVLMALRGTVEDWPGDSIYRYMTPISYAMTPDERAVIAQLGCVEAIRSGTTTLVDPFRHVAGYVDAMAATGLRLWVSEACADIDTRRIRHGDYTVAPAFGEAFFERAEALIERYHGAYGDRVRCQVAAHAPDNCSPAMLHRLRALAAKHRLTRTIHLSQSPLEAASVKERYGLTSAALLDREGFLGDDLIAAHWTFCTRDDIALLARRGVQMAHTPASISRRGMHKALLGPIRDAGVSVAFGTDNMSEDMFQAMAFGSIAWRTGRGRDGGIGREGGVDPSPQDILDAATRAGARSVGALAEIGSLAAGKKADLTFIDLNTTAMRPLIRLTSNVVHYGHPGIVHSVMVDGAFVMRDRRVLSVDEPALLAEAEAVTRRVWQRMFAQNPDIVKPESELPWLDA